MVKSEDQNIFIELACLEIIVAFFPHHKTANSHSETDEFLARVD